METVTRADVVVVGGGIAGLVAAAHSAAGGLNVVLVETRPSPGGRASTTERDGYLLNDGPHALYRTGAFAAALNDLGVPYDGRPPLLEDAMGSIGETLHRLPFGPAAVSATGLLTAPGKLDYARVMAAVSEGPREIDEGRSVENWLDALTDRADVRDLVCAMIRLGTYANAPASLSAAAAIRQQRLGRNGVLYVLGGWRSLTAGLASVARDHGARIVAGQPVHSLDATAGGWSVTVGDDRIDTRSVVVAAGPDAARKLLQLHPDAFDTAGPPITASVLDAGFSGLARHRFVHGIDQPLYLSSHAPPADLAPDGHSLMTAMWYHAPGEEPSPEAGRSTLAAHLTRAGLPVAEPSMQRYLHRMVVANGTPLATNGGEAGRPGVVVTDRPGALVAGDWVGAEGLLSDAAAASGRAAARHLLGAP